MEAMELLIWHEALGCDDEQATEEEVLARLLYSHGASEPAVDGARLQALQLMQALVAFTRMMRRESAQSQWISVVMRKRRFFIREAEPQIYMAMGLPTGTTSADLRSAHEAAFQRAYELFRLFHGSIGAQLRELSGAQAQQFADGMALLSEVASLRKRLRKIAIASDLHAHDSAAAAPCESGANGKLQTGVEELSQQLQSLIEVAPTRSLERRCSSFFPTLLRLMDVENLSLFHEVGGVGYFPMDESAFLSLQSLTNTLQAELKNVLVDDGALAVFFKGKKLWQSMDPHVCQALHQFLRFREQDGMDMFSSAPPTDGTGGSLWMTNRYGDTFSPIWSSKTTYAELAVTKYIAPQPRISSRSLRKQSPSSLSTLVSELTEARAELGGTNANAIAEQILIRRASRFRSDTPLYRNRGFLCCDGYFLPTWELEKTHKSMLWSQSVHLDRSGGESTSVNAILWHEADLSILMLINHIADDSSETLKRLERVERCLEKLQIDTMANTIWQRYISLTSASPSKDKSLPSVPPYIYRNGVNLAFKMHQIPRLIKTKQEDTTPRPPSLVAQYFPPHTLRLLNETHEELNSNPDSVEFRVKTSHDGWLVARHSHTTKRELFALIDTKAASIADAHDAFQELLAVQFPNIYL